MTNDVWVEELLHLDSKLEVSSWNCNGISMKHVEFWEGELLAHVGHMTNLGL